MLSFKPLKIYISYSRGLLLVLIGLVASLSSFLIQMRDNFLWGGEILHKTPISDCVRVVLDSYSLKPLLLPGSITANHFCITSVHLLLILNQSALILYVCILSRFFLVLWFLVAPCAVINDCSPYISRKAILLTLTEKILPFVYECVLNNSLACSNGNLQTLFFGVHRDTF